MRKFLIIVSLILSQNSFAQFTITSQQFLSDGDSIYESLLDTTNFNFGNSGMNVLWDYSSVNVNFYNNRLFLYGNISNPPIANLSGAQANTIGAFYSNYYHVDSANFNYVGYNTYDMHLWGSSESFTDNRLMLKSPFQYQDSFTDSFSGTYQYNNSGGNGSGNIYGIITKTYDAYGELRLPWANYSNVARLQVTTVYTDNIGNPNKVISGYEWYEENTHAFILSYTYNAATNSGKSLIAQSKNSINGIEIPHQLSQLTIYPNPSNGKFQIEIPEKLSNEKNIFIKFFDAMGKCILNKAFDSQNNSALINTSFSNGIYTVVLGNENVLFKNKLVVY